MRLLASTRPQESTFGQDARVVLLPKFPVNAIAIAGQPEPHVPDRFEVSPPQAGDSQVSLPPRHVDVSPQRLVHPISCHGAQKVSVMK